MSTAVLCSGQGYQGAGMFDLLADVPQATPVFKAAQVALNGRDARQFVREASADELHSDRVGQILCCTQALAAWAVLGALAPRPLVVAGYSAGELAAWGVAGLFDAEQVLSLTVQRAAAMDEATTQPSGLVAIRGLERATLDSICEAHGAYVAIVNARDQMLVGGTSVALEAVIHAAQAAGASRTTRLPVPVAGHTPLLARASEHFRQTLSQASLPAEVPSGVRLLSGIDGASVFDVAAGADKLALQIRHTVDWAACMESCRAAGVTQVIELGPGNALARFMRDLIPDADVHALSEFHSRVGVEHWLAAQSRREGGST
ncbi:MAG: acyltransferase domain-containing protein [Pseudomonadota bacterium]